MRAAVATAQFERRRRPQPRGRRPPRRRAAAADGAELVVLPEKWSAARSRRACSPSSPSRSTARSWPPSAAGPASSGSTLVAGCRRRADREGSERIANTSLLIDPEGEIAAVYRKIHMFDVEVGGVAYRESEHELPGEEVVPTRTAGELEVGLTICYDLRFPELYRILALARRTDRHVPCAFTAATGRDSLGGPAARPRDREPALRDRRRPDRRPPPHFSSWGHSMIVDPWGRVLARSPSGEGHRDRRSRPRRARATSATGSRPSQAAAPAAYALAGGDRDRDHA